MEDANDELGDANMDEAGWNSKQTWR